MTRAHGFALGALALFVATGCGDDDGPPPADAAVDARTPTPLSLRASGAEGALVLETDPLRFRIERTDGSTVLESSAEGALAFGVTATGDGPFHSPLEADPRGVTYWPLDFGLELRGEHEAVIGDAEGRQATVAIEAPSPGVYRLHLTRDAALSDVALTRAHLAADDGGYYGLGERFGHADARGTVVPMQLGLGVTASGTNEHHVPVPFFVSPLGYGVFAQSREAGAFDVGAADPGEVRATFEGGELDLWFFVHEDPRSVVAAYARHTGLPRLPPRWAFAPMHWRDEWADGAEARGDADRVRAEDVPCTTFWIDNPWQVSYNDLVFDETRFPEPARLLSDLRAQGYVPLLWSTPYLDAVDAGASPTNEAERLFVEARDRGLLVLEARTEEPYLSVSSPGATGAMVDFTSDEAIAFWQARIAPLVGMGVRAFKLDYAEDILVEALGSRLGLLFSDGRSERELHNVYNSLYHEPYRRALDEGSPEGGFLLVRAAAWGGQTTADIVWPGDLDNDFREGLDGEVGGLPAAVTALQSLAASGFPSFGSDTGGYRGGMPGREALLRWAEHTAFTPILQLGGDGAHHNPWLLDAEAGAIYRVLARAHMDLVPYFRMHAIRASTEGTPPVSSPALLYPEDRAGWGDPYAYLLGEDLFVASVVTEGATERALHLPPGGWVHWFTGEAFDGPADLTVPAPLGSPPVFVRRGAIIPMLPGDLDTLVDASDPTIVGASDRPWLRFWILPEGDRDATTEEGLDLSVHHTGDGLDLEVTPRSGGFEDARLRIDLANAEPPLTSVSSVTTGGTPVATAASRAAVEAGCDGTCWFRDGDELLVSVRSPAATAITVR